MNLTTALVGVASLILGWGLKTLTDSWTWRRQQVLNAYLELLEATDRCGNELGRVWNSGREINRRTEKWVDQALAVRDNEIEAVDRATGKVFLVARHTGAKAAIELYVACERMYRRAIAKPPSPWDHYHAAAVEMVKAYHGVVDQARHEMDLRHWQDRLPGRESRFDLTAKRLKELDRIDPLPRAQDSASGANTTTGEA